MESIPTTAIVIVSGLLISGFLLVTTTTTKAYAITPQEMPQALKDIREGVTNMNRIASVVTACGNQMNCLRV